MVEYNAITMLEKPPANYKELHDQLNKEFYEHYDVDYFNNKAIFLAGMLANPDDYLEVLAKGFKIGKIKVGAMDKTDTKWTKDFAKQELVINSYHSIESFFRLLFAHIEYPECPWLGVLELGDFKEFKKRIKDLMERKYFKQDHEKNLTTVLL